MAVDGAKTPTPSPHRRPVCAVGHYVGSRRHGDGRRRSRARGAPLAIEVPLSGGNITNGVVRVGDTVRRPRRESSSFIERLLRHLERVGFEGAPRWLGVDEQGRDMFSYLPGRVATEDDPFSDPQVTAAGRLLRTLHDATRGSALAGEQETVCHGDAAPHNMLFGRDDLPYALIDFDLAAPGDALDDIAYAAWLYCINSSWLRSEPLDEQARRLRLFTDSYGLERRRRQQVIRALISRQLEFVRWADQCLGQRQASDRLRTHAARTFARCMRERAFVLANRAALERELR